MSLTRKEVLQSQIDFHSQQMFKANVVGDTESEEHHRQRVNSALDALQRIEEKETLSTIY